MSDADGDADDIDIDIGINNESILNSSFASEWLLFFFLLLQSFDCYSFCILASPCRKQTNNLSRFTTTSTTTTKGQSIL